LVNGLSYLAVLWALGKMDVEGAPPEGQKHQYGSMKEVVAFLVRRPALAILILLATTTTVCGWPFLALLPALAQHQLSEQARGYSWLLSATGFGALTAAWVVATFSSAGRRRAFLAAGVGLVSVGLIGLSFVDSLWLAMSFCGLVGFGLILFFS